MKHLYGNRFLAEQGDTSMMLMPEKPRNVTKFVEEVYRLRDTKAHDTALRESGYDFSVDDIRQALIDYDLIRMREISNYFYKASMLYRRLILFYATLPKFFWVNIPTLVTANKPNQRQGRQGDKFYIEILNYIQKYNFADKGPDMFNAIFREGVYFGYLTEGDYENSWQQLPTQYCQTRFRQHGTNVVEFNMIYFTDTYRDEEQRDLVLRNWPPEFRRHYNRWQNGQIQQTGRDVWVQLNPDYCTAFFLSEDKIPVFFPVLKEIIRLEKNKRLDDEQEYQNLIKILVQKMPFNKNGDLLFDPLEARAFHQDLVRMLGTGTGIRGMTTWADVQMLNADTSRVAPRTIDTGDYWDQVGTSELLFNATGNISLDLSLKNDASIGYKLLHSYGTFINKRLKRRWNMNPIDYHFKFLEITQYNQDAMIDQYNKQATLGYSKLLCLIAMGVNQAEVPSLLDFELHKLKIGDLLVPLQTSHTQGNDNGAAAQAVNPGGRPPAATEDLAEGTIENIEAAT